MSVPKDKLPAREQIAARAFEIYVQGGSKNGTERANWAAAEKELLQLSSAPEQHRVLRYSGEPANLEPNSMLLDFFGLREQPFGMTPDPAYLYASETHRDALTALKFGVAENRGFFALVAQPGMGKTTLLYRLLEDLRDSARTVLVSQTQCNSHELIAYILHELGVESDGMGLVAMHGKLNEILFEELLAGKRFVLVVDEAQNLDDSVLETVRMLSNFETHNAKLVQIILAGQPRLALKLAQPKLIQLRQRISVVCHLEPFTAAETESYIAHRLRTAGHSGEAIFDAGALEEIARQSDGIPRNINNICFNAMIAAFHRGQRKVTAEAVRKAVANLELEALISKPAKAAVSAPAVAESAVSAPQVIALAPAPPKPVDPEPAGTPAMPLQNAPVESAPAFEPAPQRIETHDTLPAQPVEPQQFTVSESLPAFISAPQESAAMDEPLAFAATAQQSATRAFEPAELPQSQGIATPVSVPQPTPAATSVSAAAIPGPAQAVPSPFKPIPRSAQTPVTVPSKKGRAASDFISYEEYKKRSLKRWQIRSVIVTAILLSAILALAILGRSQSKRGIVPRLFDSTSGSVGPLAPSNSSGNGLSNYDAAPTETNDGMVLTVAASANQSIRDLSLRYVGHFDSNLSKQILVLNPDLKDPDHLEDGQLVRIPLPTGALKKMNDTGDAASIAGDADDTGGVLGRINALLRGQK